MSETRLVAISEEQVERFREAAEDFYAEYIDIADNLRSIVTAYERGIPVAKYDRAINEIRSRHGDLALAPGMECTCEFCQLNQENPDA